MLSGTGSMALFWPRWQNARGSNQHRWRSKIARGGGHHSSLFPSILQHCQVTSQAYHWQTAHTTTTAALSFPTKRTSLGLVTTAVVTAAALRTPVGYEESARTPHMPQTVMC